MTALRWPAGFAMATLLALAMRAPFMKDGHVDEVHTIGRAMQIIYTGDLNPHFFYHPTGTMYLCVPWNLLALMSLSQEVGGSPIDGDPAPLDMFMGRYANPMMHAIFNESEVEPHWDSFRLKVRWWNVLLIPAQILLLAYIGKKLNLLAPALAAGFLLAFTGANIADSVYVSVNSTTGTFCVLSVALLAFFAGNPAANTMRGWLIRLGALAYVVGLAVACKYNAGTFLLIPIVYGFMTLRDVPDGGRNVMEKMLVAFVLIWLMMGAGFTTLCPYWFKELARFMRDVLHQVWYFKVGHRDHNTFSPGLEMGWVTLRCVADQMSWLGLAASAASMGYLGWTGFFARAENRTVAAALLPVFVSAMAFFLLMSNQGVFFARNFSIVWSLWYLCCACSWWFASEELAKRLGWSNPKRIQMLVVSGLMAVCIVKANLVDALVFEREWWRRNQEVFAALKYWAGK